MPHHNYAVILEFVAVLGAGHLAGAEVVVRYGVRGPITVLDEQPQIRLRQALIRSLRILVPAIFGPTVVAAVAVAVVDGAEPGVGFRAVGLLTFASFLTAVALRWTGS